MSENPLDPPAAAPAGNDSAPDISTPLDTGSPESVPSTEEAATPQTSEGTPEAQTTPLEQAEPTQEPDGNTEVPEKLDFTKYAEDGDVERYKKLNDKFSSIEDLVKSHINLESMLGKDKMVAPTENDGEEVWTQARKALGYPDNPDAYEIPDAFDDQTSSALRSAFHEAGIDIRQSKKLLAFLGEGVEADAQAAQQSQANSAEEAIKSLEAEVGPRNSQAYKDALNQAKIAAKHLGLTNESYWLQPGFAAGMAKNYKTMLDSGFKEK